LLDCTSFEEMENIFVSYSKFILLCIPANVALVQIKEKFSSGRDYVHKKVH
jgi:hypothetical protein